jgi:Flp pilus assembly protein TadD
MSTIADPAAEALYRLGRDDEAWALTEKAEAAGADDDVITQVLIRQARAKIVSRRGEHAEAERIAHGAVARLAPADMINAQGDARVDLAIVLAAAGRSEEAVAELWTARELFTAKCNLVSAARVDRMLAEQSASIATLDS